MNGHFGGGKGTWDNPYLIEDIGDFNNIRKYPTKSFKLTKNINFATPPFDKGFLPIAFFSGQLDGDGHKLLNVYINKNDMANVGIFAFVDFYISTYNAANVHPYIKNLVIENANVTNKLDTAGILIGRMNYRYNVGVTNFSEFFQNIYISGQVSAKNNLGGLVGYLYFEHNNWANIFARDIQLDITLKPLSNLSYTSPVYGFIQSNNRSYINSVSLLKDGFIDAVIDDSSVTLSTANSSIHANSNVVQDSSYYYHFPNVIYNIDIWNGKDSTFLIPMDEETFTLSCKLVDFKTNLTDEQPWRLDYNKKPELKNVKNNLFFIRANDKYYTYLPDTQTFSQVRIYDYEQASQNGGIVNLSELTTSFYDLVQDTFGDNVEIVNIVDKNNGFKLNDEQKIDLTRDATHDYNHKFIYRQKIDLTTLTDDIYQIVSE